MNYIMKESLTQEELSELNELNLLKAEYEYELETLEEILYVLKEVISSHSPVYEEVLDYVASLIPVYEDKLSEVEEKNRNLKKN